MTFDWDADAVEPHHLREWVEGSGIDPEIAHRNLVSLSGDDALEVFLGEKLDGFTGHGQQYATAPVARLLNNYDHLKDGGWLCRPLITSNSWRTSSDWCCFKPDNPRKNSEGKLIKYEHPPGMATGIFYLRGTDDSYWPEIFAKPATYTVVITEGAKKAAALMTTGIPAVALPGIWNGTPKDDNGAHCLHPDLLPLIGHRIVILFDHSDKTKGRRDVQKASLRLAEHLYRAGCPQVSSTVSPGPEKGIDDVLVNRGAAAVHAIVAKAPVLNIAELLK